jgi:hypothetical protein
MVKWIENVADPTTGLPIVTGPRTRVYAARTDSAREPTRRGGIQIDPICKAWEEMRKTPRRISQSHRRQKESKNSGTAGRTRGLINPADNLCPSSERHRAAQFSISSWSQLAGHHRLADAPMSPQVVSALPGQSLFTSTKARPKRE